MSGISLLHMQQNDFLFFNFRHLFTCVFYASQYRNITNTHLFVVDAADHEQLYLNMGSIGRYTDFVLGSYLFNVWSELMGYLRAP